MRECGIYIDGGWTSSTSGATFDSLNPATGEPIARLQRSSTEDVDRAVAAATEASRTFARMPVWRRAGLCERVAEVMVERRAELAEVVSREQGKPLATEAYAEVDTAIEGYRSAASHVKHLYGETIPVAHPHKRVLTQRQPHGVYAVVTPWNFPVNIPAEYLGPALATGNTVVWVPAPTTSLCAVVMAEVFHAAEVPPGVINLVTGDGAVVGDAAVAHSGTHAVGFTGSTRTGRSIANRAAGKPQLLELGGNGPTIVFADADLPAAAKAIAAGTTFNAGQCCSATEFVLAERSIMAELTELVAEHLTGVRLGPPQDESTQMGPLNNEQVADKMDHHIADATGRGAKVVLGGSRAAGVGSDLFFEPTLLTDVDPDSVLAVEESFGPLAPIAGFDTEEDVLRIADRPCYGLVASVWTRSAGRGIRVAETLRTGMVNINEASTYWEIHLPFGGGTGTGSGMGRLGGMQTLMAMTELKTITLDLRRM